MVAGKPGEKEDPKDNKGEKENVDNKVNGVTSNNAEPPKVQSNETTTVLKVNEGYVQDQSGVEKGIILNNMYAKWIPDVSEDTLSNISMTVTPGKLTAIIGPVGVGKVNYLLTL